MIKLLFLIFPLKRIIFIAVIITALSFAAFSQTTRKKTARHSSSGNKAVGGNTKIAAQQSNSVLQPITPLADHHTHIWSENASALIREPLMPVVELPDDLKRLLQD